MYGVEKIEREEWSGRDYCRKDGVPFCDGVGRPLLEASIAAKREQDYCLPIEWKLPLAEYFFYWNFFTTATLHYLLINYYLHHFKYLDLFSCLEQWRNRVLGMLDLSFMYYFMILLFLIQRAHACFMGGKLYVCALDPIHSYYFTEPYPFLYPLASARFLPLHCTNQMRPAFHSDTLIAPRCRFPVLPRR